MSSQLKKDWKEKHKLNSINSVYTGEHVGLFYVDS